MQIELIFKEPSKATHVETVKITRGTLITVSEKEVLISRPASPRLSWDKDSNETVTINFIGE